MATTWVRVRGVLRARSDEFRRRRVFTNDDDDVCGQTTDFAYMRAKKCGVLEWIIQNQSFDVERERRASALHMNTYVRTCVCVC